jgi:MYXO-CTERM domain-containing protein
MRDILVFAALVGLSIACGPNPPARGGTPEIGTTTSAIIGGAIDSGDPSVIELLYIVLLPPSACDGGPACLQSCLDTTGQPCTSGATCLCGVSAKCTGELVGPHSVVTAGHCTDLSPRGALSGGRGPALTLCTSRADVTALASGMAPSSGCNVDVLALFNNRCASTDSMDSCEKALIQYGDYIIADKVVNPGYVANASFADGSAGMDNDIGLVRLASATLVNGGGEPGVIVFNRSDLGPQCTDLGELKFVGYGISDPSQGASALSGLKYTVTHDAKVKDAWHIEADGSQANPAQTCGAGTGEEPICMGDSGGPSFDGAGLIVGIASLGDMDCSILGVSTRIDAYAGWIDTTMAGWGDPKNGTAAPTDSGAADACRACAGNDTGTQSAPEASSPEGNAETSTEETESGTGAATVQSNGSGGCSVGVAAPEGRPRAFVPLLIVAMALVRRRAKHPPGARVSAVRGTTIAAEREAWATSTRSSCRWTVRLPPWRPFGRRSRSRRTSKLPSTYST